ncbi:MAG: hypothetical protein J1G30_02920, partial [Spirochaetales bacterium]|nr:hypothetical protein [Spirochaetales bacterium]
MKKKLISFLFASMILFAGGCENVTDRDVTSTDVNNGYSIVWKGSLSKAPSNPVSGWAYYDTTQKKSFIYDGTSWQ